MRKKDILLILILLGAAGLLWAALSFAPKTSGDTLYAVAKIDGKEAGRWLLGEDAEADIDSAYGHNHLSVRGGEAVMTEADCPDGYCMEQHAIGLNGGSIICLPHHLVIEIRTEDGRKTDGGVDGVAK
ncbi:MAG: NusG domain II-containing protein [Lachnospiraceae bacterium]|nr:NusG domain II-containing protein [Lachnospiraceae bacterium]